MLKPNPTTFEPLAPRRGTLAARPTAGDTSALSRRGFVRGCGTALGVSALLPAPLALAQFRVEITGIGATQVPVAVAPFRGETEAGLSVASVVRANLERSGVFRIVPTDARLDERSMVAPVDWRSRGVDALVAGSVSRLADGRMDVRFRLWDVVRDEQLVGQSKLVVPADLRLAAHRVSDDIHEALTGERGIYATRIAYVVKSGARYTLHVADADGEGGQVAVNSVQPLISPAWSPDGKRLAYVSFETGKASVWVQDLAGGERRMVANFRGSNSAPAWSPDGRRLAVALSQAGSTQLFTMPATGGTPQLLSSSGSIDTEPVYSADGRHVYFVSDRGGSPQIYRIGAGGGAVERVTFQGNYNISPSLSPDGRLLACISRNGQAYRVTTQELAPGGARMELTDTRDDESPSFAPNGRLIVYATRHAGTDVLMTTTLDGKIKTRLLSTGADMREPAWGPFGR
jgi:TolB protein